MILLRIASIDPLKGNVYFISILDFDNRVCYFHKIYWLYFSFFLYSGTNSTEGTDWFLKIWFC